MSGSTHAPQSPPPDNDGGSCSPAPGVTAPVNGLGLLATYLAGIGLWFLARRRFGKR